MGDLSSLIAKSMPHVVWLCSRTGPAGAHPVVTVRGGEDVAEVRDVIYDPEAGRLVGLTLHTGR